MEDFLAFRKMLTPIIIQIIFWIGIAVIVISAFVQMVQGGQAFFMGLVTLILGPIIWRIYCELIIVIFRILDVLTDIRNGNKGESAASDTM